jgi:NDP-sugar pyrophosphorylase family protein
VHPKPHTSSYANACRMAGVFILNREILNLADVGVYAEIGKDLIPSALKTGREFWGYFCNDYSKGIDTLDKKDEVETYLTSSGIATPAISPGSI